jgi:hypothetical protein
MTRPLVSGPPCFGAWPARENRLNWFYQIGSDFRTSVAGAFDAMIAGVAAP